MPHHHEPIGILVRERLEQDGVDHREDRGVRADAEREHDEHGGGEAGALAEAAKGVAHVLQGGRDDWNAPPLTVLLRNLLHAPERQDGLPPGLLRGEARALVVVGVHAEMRLDFVREVAIAARTVEQTRDPPGPRTKPPHHHPSRGARNRARISVVSCHSRASAASCLRPARVSV